MSALDNLFHGVLGASRKKVFKRFIECIRPQGYDVILDLGAAGDFCGEQPFSEDNYKQEDNISARRSRGRRTTSYPEALMACSPVIHESKKKILMVGPLPPTVGGITTLMTSILESDLNKKYAFIPFTTSRPPLEGKVPSIQNYAMLFRVRIRDLLRSLGVTFYHLLIFPIILLKVKPDIVHIHTSSYWSFWENSVYVLTSKIFKIKVILHVHGSVFDKFCKNQNLLMKNLTRFIMKISENVIALSLYWKNFFTNEMCIRDPGKVVVIHNGVDSSKYMSESVGRSKSRDKVEVLFIGGAYSKRKGIYDLINAIPLVLEKVSNINFRLIGKSELEHIEVLCRDLEIEKYVMIFPQVPEQEKILQFRSSDIFVLPTRSEGMPIALLEAMAAGLPIVSTPVGAIPEVVDEGKNGFLIEPGDYKALAEKIGILAQDEKLRQEMGKNNLEKIRKQYDLPLMIGRMDREYKKLLGN